jgi:hypothetical protein
MTNNTKMLRLSEKSANWLKKVLEESYTQEFGPAPAEFHANVLMIKGWLELEPAPPQFFEELGPDIILARRPWHPACRNRLGCGFSERFEECIGCPYRHNGPVD